MIQWKPKKRQCKAPGCKCRFLAEKEHIWWCSPDCGVALAQARMAKARAKKESHDRKETRERKRQIETIGQLLRRVQRAFNEYIRERDWDKPCISCGRVNDGRHKRDAGHYKAVGRGGGSPARFHPDNCHVQCSVNCNVHGGGGNHPDYRPNLVARIGEERVQAVERLHAGTVKWDRAALEGQRAWFAAEARRMKREREQRGMVGCG